MNRANIPATQPLLTSLFSNLPSTVWQVTNLLHGTACCCNIMCPLVQHSLPTGATQSAHCCRSINRKNIPAGEPLLMSLFGSLPSMPSHVGDATLQYTIATMIGAYASWLAATVRVEQQGQILVSQLLHLLMKCKLCLPVMFMTCKLVSA